MKHFHAFNLPRLLQPRNLLPRLKRPRIPSRRHHHAHRCIPRPPKIPFAHASLHRRLQRVHQIALQPHQNRLRLGIPKARIELQHHRTPRRHHQPAVEHALELRALNLHPRDHRTRNVIHQPIPHRVIDDVRRRVSSHAASVGPSVPIANPFVVLRRHQRGHPLPIAQH